MLFENPQKPSLEMVDGGSAITDCYERASSKVSLLSERVSHVR